MQFVETNQRSRIEPLFSGWEETMIWSCLQGYMGEAWCDCLEHPSSAVIVIGDFCFLAGRPDQEMLSSIWEQDQSECWLVIPQTIQWCAVIETVFAGKYFKTSRYSIKKEPDVFNHSHLQKLCDQLPSDCRLEMIGEPQFNIIKKEEELKDLCSQFGSWPEYQKNGIGVVVSCRDEIVAGASSYTVYDKGIEIEIDTKKAYRRRGLAAACGAKLILECQKLGLYPSWDAHDLRSVSLAKKLGYHMDREYLTYVVVK